MAPRTRKSPDDHAVGAQPGQPQDRVVDGGFLKLVRYGVRAGNDRHILASLGEYDDQTCEDLTRVRYDFGPQDDTTPS